MTAPSGKPYELEVDVRRRRALSWEWRLMGYIPEDDKSLVVASGRTATRRAAEREAREWREYLESR